MQVCNGDYVEFKLGKEIVTGQIDGIDYSSNTYDILYRKDTVRKTFSLAIVFHRDILNVVSTKPFFPFEEMLPYDKSGLVLDEGNC